jgi:hypothetical protein
VGYSPAVAQARQPPVRQAAGDVRAVVGHALADRGQRLHPDVRDAMERRLGHDLSRVRVHDDRRAAEAAQLVGARAFTVGWDLLFAPSQYEPHSAAGHHLLAHELAHAVQQRDASGGIVLDPRRPDLDGEAERIAAAHGGTRVAGRLGTRAVQRQASGEAYDLSLTYPPNQAERHRALTPAAALAVLTGFANRIDIHIAGAYEGHRYLHQIHQDQWIVAGISDILGGRSIPSLEIWSWPRMLLRSARASIARGAIPEAARELQLAAQVTRAAERRVYEYREGTIAGAERAVFGLEVVQVASTAIVTAGTGGTAGVLLGAGLAGTQRLAGEATAVHLGLKQEIDWAGIAFDTIAAAVTGHLAGRLGSAVATRLAVKIGSRVAAGAVTAVIVGRASGIVHAAVRELFDALRGRTALTWEQFIDRLADQLTLRAAFLDLAGYAAAAATPQRPQPAIPPPGPPAPRPRPRLTPLQGGGAARGRPVGSAAAPVSGTRAMRGRAMSAAPALEPSPALEPAPAPETAPALREVPMPAAEVPRAATPSAPSGATSPSSAVATAAAAGPAAATSTPSIQVPLELPPEKKMHAPLYQDLIRARALEHTPGLPRHTAQADNWDRELRPGGDMQMDLRSWVGMERIGIPDARKLRPNWSRRTERVNMQVDHRVEWQLLGAANRTWGDSMPNYELLDEQSNENSGRTLKNNIIKTRRDLAAKTGNPAWNTQRIVFTQLVVPPGPGIGERWLPEEIRDGAHYRAYLRFERRRLR